MKQLSARSVIVTDLPALVVALPLLGSIIALLAGLGRSATGWYVALGTMLLQVIGTGLLATEAFRAGPVRYVVGGFTAPYGIELVIDGLSATMIVLIAVIALGILGYARSAGPRSNPFYAAYLILVGGLTGVSVTGDIFNMYVFLEISGIAAYTLVAAGEGGESAHAAFKYLLVGTVGASLFLFGVGYAYIATGTLNMADLATKLVTLGYTDPLVQAAFVLLVVGLFVKIAVFPLHTWQPDAYAGAPDSVSGLISALVSTTAAYALIRIVFSVFTIDFLLANPLAQSILGGAAIVSIIVGSVLAVAQSDIKRLLAYSSVSQFGLIIGAIAVANGTALIGAAIHLVGHAVMKGGLFLAAGIISRTTGARTIESYEGLATHRPGGAATFSLLAFALVGVPPAVGFVGKWYIALGAVEAEAWPLAFVILASTLLTLAYFTRLVERMYFRDSPLAGADIVTTDTDDFPPIVADGEGRARPAVTFGMRAVVIAAGVLSVLLGVVAFEYSALLEPTINRLLA